MKNKWFVIQRLVLLVGIALAVPALFAVDVIVLDVSGSMATATAKGVTRIDRVVSDLREAAMQPGFVDADVIAFSDGIRWRAKLQPEPRSLNALAKKLREEAALDRRTALWASLRAVIAEYANGSHASITVISDLADNESSPNAEAEVFAALRQAGASRIRLSFVGLGSDALEKLTLRVPDNLRSRVAAGSSLDFARVLPPVIQRGAAPSSISNPQTFFVTGWPSATRFAWFVDGIPQVSTSARMDVVLGPGLHLVGTEALLGNSTRLRGQIEVVISAPPSRLAIAAGATTHRVGEECLFVAETEGVEEIHWKVGAELLGQGRVLRTRFAAAGSFALSAEGRGPDGSLLTDQKNVIVEFSPATAAFDSPLETPAGSPVRLGDASTGDIVAWSWRTSEGRQSTERNPVFAFGTPDAAATARVTIRLEIKVRDGRTLATERTIQVLPVPKTPPPAATLKIPAEGRVNEPITVGFVSQGGPVTEIEWNVDGQVTRDSILRWLPTAAATTRVGLTLKGPGGKFLVQRDLVVRPAWRAPELRVVSPRGKLVATEALWLEAAVKGDAKEIRWHTPEGSLVGARVRVVPATPGTWNATVVGLPNNPQHDPAIARVTLAIMPRPDVARRWFYVSLAAGLVAVGGATWQWHRRRTFGILELSRGDRRVECMLSAVRQSVNDAFADLDEPTLTGFVRHRPGSGMELVLTSTGEVLPLGYGTPAALPIGGTGIGATLRL